VVASNRNTPGSISITVNTPDTTAPTFTSSTLFTVAENFATSSNAATVKASESATITISSGADISLFNIITSDSVTAVIRFKVSPNYEAPTDSGGDNIYNLTLTATDTANNAGIQSISIRVTDLVDTSSFTSFALAGSATTATYRTAVVISAIVNVASKVTFSLNGKSLPGCKNRSTTGSASTHTATCTWKPSRRGQLTLSAVANPAGEGIASSNVSPVNIMVGNRTGAR
jgi:serralysin